MKKYEYKYSAFGKARQEKAKEKENNKENTKKTYGVYPWKTYGI